MFYPDSNPADDFSHKLPKHVAIIMDGNGRWARSRGLPRTAGHKKGAEAARKAIEAAGEMGIGYLTLFAFSSENWNRPQDEISDLMGLLKYYLKNELKSIVKNGVRLRVIGDLSAFSEDIQSLLAQAIEDTRENSRLQLTIALNYGARAEILRALTTLADQITRGEKSTAEITEEDIRSNLYTHDLPDPDLLIRTSGEVRISNFLLWQLAYTELYFTETLWPDFSKEDLQKACADYATRERRFGAIKILAQS